MKYLLILTVLMLFACNSTRKAQRQVLGLQQKHPAVLADACRTFYPPILRPGKSDTTNTPDGSLQRIVDSLTGKVGYLQGQAENAEKRADSAIFASLLNRDTSCANLIRSLKGTITSQKNEINRLLEVVTQLRAKADYMKLHPLTVTNTVFVTDSAIITVLTHQRDVALQAAAHKDGEIKQLKAYNRRALLVFVGAIVAGVAAFFLKPKLL